MRETTAQQLRAVAPQILSGQITAETPFCPDVVKRAIAILNTLKDNQWHTAAQVAESLKIGAKYARDVLRECAPAWQLESHRRNGWRFPLNVCPQCKSIYYLGDEGDHIYHECDCGWHWLEPKSGNHEQADENQKRTAT